MALLIDEKKLAEHAVNKLDSNMDNYIDKIFNYELFMLPLKTYLQIAFSSVIIYYVIKSIKELKK